MLLYNYLLAFLVFVFSSSYSVVGDTTSYNDDDGVPVNYEMFKMYSEGLPSSPRNLLDEKRYERECCDTWD